MGRTRIERTPRELECIGDGNIEIGIGDQLRELISQVLSFSLFIVHIFFFFVFVFVVLGFSVCLGISFATFSPAFFDLLSFSAVSLSPFLNFQGAVSLS